MGSIPPVRARMKESAFERIKNHHILIMFLLSLGKYVQRSTFSLRARMHTSGSVLVYNWNDPVTMLACPIDEFEFLPTNWHGRLPSLRLRMNRNGFELIQNRPKFGRSDLVVSLHCGPLSFIFASSICAWGRFLPFRFEWRTSDLCLEVL